MASLAQDKDTDSSEAPFAVSPLNAKVDSSISSVDVFADSRAQVTRVFPKIALPPNKLASVPVRGLPAGDIIDQQSVRVLGKVVGTCSASDTVSTVRALEKQAVNAAILDVTWTDKWVAAVETTPEALKTLESDLESSRDELDALQASLNSVSRQLQFIDGYGDAILGRGAATASSSASDNSASRPPALLSKDALDGIGQWFTVHSQHSESLQKAKLAKVKQIKQLSDKIAAMEANLAKLRGGNRSGQQKIGEVGVLIKTIDGRANKENNEWLVMELTMIYVVSRASWTPLYDVRVNSEDQSVELLYKAKLMNNTGEPWTRVTLSLSTSRPTSASNPPSKPSNPWRISLRQRYDMMPRAKGRGLFSAPSAAPMMLASAAPPQSAAYGGFDENVADGIFQQQERKQAFYEEQAEVAFSSGLTGTSVFKVPGKPTIEDDGAEHAVTISRLSGSVSSKEGLVPKFEYIGYLRQAGVGYMGPPGSGGENVWATMKCTNTTEWDLLQGPAGIFVDDAFVSRIPLPATPPNESFTLPLGPSNSLRISRSPPLKSRETSSLFSSGTGGGLGSLLGGKLSVIRISERSTFKNSQRTSVSLTVIDQLPTSQDDKVKTGVFDPATLGELIKRGEREGKVKASVQLFPLGKSEELLATRRASTASGSSSGQGTVEANVKWSKDTGVVEWEFTLPGATEAVLGTGYEVAWPVGENVDGL